MKGEIEPKPREKKKKGMLDSSISPHFFCSLKTSLYTSTAPYYIRHIHNTLSSQLLWVRGLGKVNVAYGILRTGRFV